MNMTLDVVGSERKVTLDLPEPKEAVLHEVVAWQLAKRRRGTAATKTRSMVRGSTAKIYPQKGTGRARHGSRKAPIFVGGGISFGPQPRDYAYTLPKRVRRLGLQMALSARAGDGKLTLVESFGIGGKTREFVAWASEHGFDGKERVLLVTDDEMTRRAARNLPWVGVLPRRGLNVYDVLRYEHLIADAELFADGDGDDAAVETAETPDTARGATAVPTAVSERTVEGTDTDTVETADTVETERVAADDTRNVPAENTGPRDTDEDTRNEVNE